MNGNNNAWGKIVNTVQATLLVAAILGMIKLSMDLVLLQERQEVVRKTIAVHIEQIAILQRSQINDETEVKDIRRELADIRREHHSGFAEVADMRRRILTLERRHLKPMPGELE